MSMSKTTIKSSSNEQAGYGYGFVLNESDRGYMEGRLLTFLESLGLKDSQEKAAKDLLRQEVNSWFYPNALGITGELNTAVQNIVHRIRQHHEQTSTLNGLPTSTAAYGFDFEIIATEK